MLPILKFAPLFKSTVWGGRKLSSSLGKELPDQAPYGESWEIVDLPEDQSRVLHEERTLGDLRRDHQSELLGDSPLLEGRFPLLIKYIDAKNTLSVQVHPDEEACAKIGGGARPKTEAWYIIDRDPGAVLYVGLKEGVSEEVFRSACERGQVDALLQKVPVEPGDLVYLPAGTVHAIGEGILLAEVQQSSSTTYRVFDWNRVGLDGKPRQLHVEQALRSTHFHRVGPPPLTPPESGRFGMICDFFSMEILDLDEGAQSLTMDGASIFMGVGGGVEATVRAGEEETRLGLGETVLVPASMSGRRLEVSGPGAKIMAVGVRGKKKIERDV